jgi:UDP-galactopyranose mutase
VISTPIRDVVRPYGDNNLVYIVSNADEFIKAGEKELNKKRKTSWLKKVDDFLLYNSWDRTWGQMVRHIEDAFVVNSEKSNKTKKAYV